MEQLRDEVMAVSVGCGPEPAARTHLHAVSANGCLQPGCGEYAHVERLRDEVIAVSVGCGPDGCVRAVGRDLSEFRYYLGY